MGSIGDVGAGHTLGRYELLVPIALGGMASVWAARTTGAVQKIVAVKLMRAELSEDPDFEQMFLDEASVVSHIRHPNVAEILDLGEEDGALYQVMEWVDGEPLNVVLRESKARGGMPLAVALRIIKQACAGLHAAHELRGPDGDLVGLVHRDATPQNILIGYDGAVKIVDFGVAKAALNKGSTRTGTVKGKAPYMSPEQARGERVDRRSDVFAIGIVLYQLITGAHPFMGQTEYETMLRIITGTSPQPPSKLAPGLPEELDAIVMRALAPAPEGRFATMLEVMRALDRATPPGMQLGAEQLAEYMRQVVGPRGERRRAAIREAVQLAQSERPQPSGPSRPSRPSQPSRPSPRPAPAPPPVASSPELAALVQAAAAAARGDAPRLAPAVPAARLPPWAVRAEEARRARNAVFGGIGIALILVIGAVTIFTLALREDPLVARSIEEPVERVTRAVSSAAAAAPAPAPKP